MTVSYRKNASDIWRELAYLATRTVIGWLFLAFILIFPLSGPAIVFFSTPPGTKIEPIAVITSLLVFVAGYAIFSLYVLLGVYLSARIAPKITIMLKPEHCYMTSLISLKAAWRSFERMVDEPEFFYFFGWLRFAFIPKHAFASQAEADRFYHTALTYWHEAKGTVPPPAFPDPSGIWPPAPQTTASQEPGGIGER